jgi:DNA-binding NarL/FixJ family response regulator
MNILLVDDDPVARGVIKSFPRRHGVKATNEAGDGEAAFKVLQNFAADLVILDIRMQPMNGLEFLKQLRCGERGPRLNLPVIVLTGVADEVVFGTALALDCHGFVAKAEATKYVLDRIDRVLTKDHPMKPAQAYAVIDIPQLPPAAPARRDERVGSRTAAQTFDDSRAQLFQRSLVTIHKGAVLGQDLRTRDGTTLLTKGSKLSQADIVRLQDLDNISGVEDPWIIKPYD